MIRVTHAQARHFRLQKSFLAGPKAADIMTAIKGLVTLPAPDEIAPFLALRARLAEFEPADLPAELYQTRRLLRRPGPGNEPHVLAVADFGLILAATGRQRRQAFHTACLTWEVEAAEIEALAEDVLAAIGETPVTAAQLEAMLPPEKVRPLSQTSRGGRVSRSSTLQLALQRLESEGRLAVGRPSPPADWREPAQSYAPPAVWWPNLDLSSDLSEAEAQRRLVWAYLAAYGPAGQADISFWSGFGQSETQRAINALAAETTLVMVEGSPGAMLLLKEQSQALRDSRATEEPLISLLPADDPFVRAHQAGRAGLFAEPTPRRQRQIFNSAGRAKPTILVNGQIVGWWELLTEPEPAQLQWHYLAPVEPAIAAQIATALAELGQFLGATLSADAPAVDSI